MEYSPLDYDAGLKLGQILFPDMAAQEATRRQLAVQEGTLAFNRFKDQAATDEEGAFQTDMAEMLRDPSAAKYAWLVSRHPKHAQAIQESYGALDKAEREATFTRESGTYHAAKGKKWDLVESNLQQQVDSEIAATGKADPTHQHLLDLVKARTPDGLNEALGTMGYALRAAEPEKFEKVFPAPKTHDVGLDHQLLKEDPDTGEVSVEWGQGRAKYGNGGVIQPIPNAAPLPAPQPTVVHPSGPVTPGDEPLPGAGGAPGVPPRPPPYYPGRVAAPPAAGAAAPPTGFDQVIGHIVDKNEGGYNAHDRDGLPTNWGIHENPANRARMNRMGVKDIKDLTKAQAVDIYRDYWNESGAGNLAPNLQVPYFDAYIRGPVLAKTMLAKSGGDPVKFAQLSGAAFQAMGAKDADPKWRNHWAKRDAANLGIASGQPGAATATPAAAEGGSAGVGPFGVPAPPPGYEYVIPPAPKDAPAGYRWTATGDLEAIPGGPAGDKVTDVLKKYNLQPDDVGAPMLAKLPANLAAKVKAVAEGRLVIGQRAMTQPYGQELNDLALQYDPDYDVANAPARKAAILSFTGTGKGSQLVGSFNRAGNHIWELQKASNELGGPHGTGYGPIDSVVAKNYQDFNRPAAVRYDNTVQFLAGELEKIARASPGTVTGVEAAIKNLDRRQPPEVRNAAIKSVVKIIAGAADPLREQFNSAFTNKSARPQIGWVSPKAQAIYRRIGGYDASLEGAGGDPIKVHSEQEYQQLVKEGLLRSGDTYLDPKNHRRTKG